MEKDSDEKYGYVKAPVKVKRVIIERELSDDDVKRSSDDEPLDMEPTLTKKTNTSEKSKLRTRTIVEEKMGLKKVILPSGPHPSNPLEIRPKKEDEDPAPEG